MCLHLDIIICHQSYQHCRKHQQSLSLSPPFLYIPIHQEYICGLKYKDKSVTIHMNMFLHFWYPKYKDTPGVSNLGTGTSKVHLRHLNSKYMYLKYKNTPGVSNLGGTGAS